MLLKLLLLPFKGMYHMHKPAFQLLLLISLSFLLGACQSTSEPTQTATGLLRGHVSFLPTWLEIGASGKFEPMPADFYAQRKILILGDGEAESYLVSLDELGNYQVELAPGSYFIDVRGTQLDLGIGLPAPVEIVAGKEVILDITVDTGLR